MTRQKLLNHRLELYLEAEELILSGQSYRIGDRTLTRANLSEVRYMIEKLLSMGAVIEGMESDSKVYVKRVVFHDT